MCLLLSYKYSGLHDPRQNVKEVMGSSINPTNILIIGNGNQSTQYATEQKFGDTAPKDGHIAFRTLPAAIEVGRSANVVRSHDDP